MPCTILVTGFGPFPAAPFNPTATLAYRLARLRRPALADVRIVPHVFATSYAAIDRDLPQLIARHKPEVILMFGLAARRRPVTIETRVRNTVSALFADAAGDIGRSRTIARGEPSTRPFPPWSRALVPPVRAARVPAQLSRDAGRYVCNYLCWRALEAARPDGPLVAVVPVPQVRRVPHPRMQGPRRPLTIGDLVRAGEAVLIAATAAARRIRIRNPQPGGRVYHARHLPTTKPGR
jgi:pyroglutamyl-peptidase